jgi:hypothetical protein
MTQRLVKQEDTVKLGKYCENGINRIFELEFSMRTITIALMLNSTSEESSALFDEPRMSSASAVDK